VKEPISVGYYRLDIPTSADKPEVSRIVEEFTTRFEEAVSVALADSPASHYTNEA
jgi:hypothetical protein